MLFPQVAQCEPAARQGSQAVKLDELRSCMSEPSRLTNQHQQRLLELLDRLDRVRALGDEYAGVELSASATEALAMAGQAS